MTSKHYKWQAQWQRLPNGGIKHSSGLVVEYDDALGWQTEDASLAIFQASEKARGVPLHDIASRLQRLLREASEIDESHATENGNPRPSGRGGCQ